MCSDVTELCDINNIEPDVGIPMHHTECSVGEKHQEITDTMLKVAEAVTKGL